MKTYCFKLYRSFSVDEKGWADDLWKRQGKTSLIEAVPLTPQFAEKTRRSSAGFDFGLKTFLTASDGKDIISPLFFAQNSMLIKNACKKLSHKKKGSKNRRKAKLNLARLYKKSFNQRHDFHFKLARQLCLEYKKICIEDLNIKAMQRLWGRKISDLAFSEFVNILKYEATKFGVEIIETNRYFASSQICS